MPRPVYQPGQWVRVTNGALRAQIIDQGTLDDSGEPCMGMCCGRADCNAWSWATLHTEPDPECEGKRHMLCHVCESQMEASHAD